MKGQHLDMDLEDVLFQGLDLEGVFKEVDLFLVWELYQGSRAGKSLFASF